MEVDSFRIKPISDELAFGMQRISYQRLALLVQLNFTAAVAKAGPFEGQQASSIPRDWSSARENTIA